VKIQIQEHSEPALLKRSGASVGCRMPARISS